MAGSGTGDARDTEITLGTGKLLGIFFGLVLLCSIFFTMGYMLGRSNGAGSKTEIIGSETGGNSAGKPSANRTGQAGTANSAATQPNPPTASASATPAPTVSPVELAPASSVGTPGGGASNTAVSGATYVVQVAAVSKREDADLLVSALQKKQYPVFVANVPGDALFHVQVGPFADPKDAETIRTRLVAEGYNPIVKRSS